MVENGQPAAYTRSWLISSGHILQSKFGAKIVGELRNVIILTFETSFGQIQCGSSWRVRHTRNEMTVLIVSFMAVIL